MTHDLSKIPPPDIIEPLSYELILSRMQEALVAKDPQFSALVESDPAIKVLEIAAWREFLLRQRVNDAVRANLLAFAGTTMYLSMHLGCIYRIIPGSARHMLLAKKTNRPSVATIQG